MNSSRLIANNDYAHWLKQIKQRIHSVRMKVALAANSELIALYYEIGAQIVERESSAQWGSGFIDAFSKDLRTEFPDVGGFSAKNLRYCRAFFRFYCDPEIWQQAVAKLASEPLAGVNTDLAQTITLIPWGLQRSNTLISKICAYHRMSFGIRPQWGCSKLARTSAQ